MVVGSVGVVLFCGGETEVLAGIYGDSWAYYEVPYDEDRQEDQ